MSDENSNCIPQPPDKVARRALALCAVSCRGFIDSGKGNADAEQLHQRIIQWVQRLSLTTSLSSHEWDSIRAPLGTLEKNTTNTLGWEAESIAVFAWALGHADLPAHDNQTDPYSVTDTFLFLSDEAADLITNAALRPSHELHAYRELMYAIHCRLVGFMRNGTQDDFTTWIDKKWLDDLEIPSGRIPFQSDLRFEGVPLIKIPKKKLPSLETLVAYQHRASIWLIGEEDLHWNTVADT